MPLNGMSLAQAKRKQQQESETQEPFRLLVARPLPRPQSRHQHNVHPAAVDKCGLALPAFLLKSCCLIGI